MEYPIFKDKYKEEPVFTAEQFTTFMQQQGSLELFPTQKGIIFCYQRSLLRTILAENPTREISFNSGELYLLEGANKGVGVVGGFGCGAPIATIILEDLIALGHRRFINMGTAGAINPNLEIGDFVICDRAIRDEGVSHHYVEAGRYSYPSAELTARLKSALNKLNLPNLTGTTWTTDAPYRETNAEVEQYRNEGVLTVEMEAAAMFAVARDKGVALASAFVISDLVGKPTWQPGFKGEGYKKGLENLFKAAVNAVVES